MAIIILEISKSRQKALVKGIQIFRRENALIKNDLAWRHEASAKKRLLS